MTQSTSYFAFVWKEKHNRKLLLSGIITCIALLVGFKFLYPFADVFNDSYWYVYAAAHKLDISIWPIGYSKFLSAFHFFTHSDTALVAFQYLFFQLAAIHFFFTLLYFFNIKSWIQRTIYWFIILNPLSLYIANTVASDTIFGGLTLLWLAEMIWIILRPKLYQLVIQAVILFCCFTMRNTTYYYPIVAALAIILSKQAVWKKLAGIALPILLWIPFIENTKEAAFKLTGTRTFSLLTGWQLANNALYFYDRIKVDSTQLPDENAREVNRRANAFFKHMTPFQYRLFINSTDGNVYIINYASPIKQFMVAREKATPNFNSVKEWGKASAAFEPFGKYILIHYPWAYFRYFVLMNAGNYLLPQLSDLKTFSNNRDQIEPLIANWFGYPSTAVTSVSKSIQGNLFVYQVFFFLLHIYFLGVALLIFFKARIIKFPRRTVHLYCLLTAYLLINAVFSSVVTINLLRYQYIPMYILLLNNLLLTENILRLYAERPKAELPEVSYNPTPL